MNITRRSFLRNLGTGLLVAAAPELLLPERKQWFVGANAPVASRLDLRGPYSNMLSVDWAPSPLEREALASAERIAAQMDADIQARIERMVEAYEREGRQRRHDEEIIVERRRTMPNAAWISAGERTLIRNTGDVPIFVGAHHLPDMKQNGLRIAPSESLWVPLPDWRISVKS